MIDELILSLSEAWYWKFSDVSILYLSNLSKTNHLSRLGLYVNDMVVLIALC